MRLNGIHRRPAENAMNGLFAMTAPATHRPRKAIVDPRLATALRQVLVLGAVLVLLVPAARGYNTWLGWMPLWLLGMPLSALWALHRFRLPRLAQAQAMTAVPRRRRGGQARRRALQRGSRRLPQAA